MRRLSGYIHRSQEEGSGLSSTWQVRDLRRQNPRKAAVTERNREGKEMKESRGRYPMIQEGGEQDSLLESPGLQECSQTQQNP